MQPTCLRLTGIIQPIGLSVWLCVATVDGCIHDIHQQLLVAWMLYSQSLYVVQTLYTQSDRQLMLYTTRIDGYTNMYTIKFVGPINAGGCTTCTQPNL